MKNGKYEKMENVKKPHFLLFIFFQRYPRRILTRRKNSGRLRASFFFQKNVFFFKSYPRLILTRRKNSGRLRASFFFKKMCFSLKATPDSF